MSRLISALVVCSLCVLFAFAQEAPKAPPVDKRVRDAGEVPFLVTEVDGKAAWTLRGQMEIPLSELIDAWVRATGVSLPVLPRSLAVAVSYQAPPGGVTLKGDAITDFVCDMLAQVRLTLVGFSTGRAQIVQAQEAASFARVVDRTELATIPASEWVTLCVMLRYSDANAVRAGLQNLMTRSGGIAAPVAGANGILITDRADRVRQLAKVTDALDSSETGERTLEKYDLPEGVDPGGAASAIVSLLKPTLKFAPDIDVSVVPGKSRLLVRANAAQHAEVKRAVELMK